MATTITEGQLQELKDRTAAVLNAANEAADDGRISDSDADFVEDQLSPIFEQASTALDALQLTTPEPPPEPARAPRRRYV